ncbi:M56 family peptidase, partial [Streptomyces sp. NPDC059466]
SAPAALASSSVRSDRPDFAPAATTGPVPQRVAALLAAPSGHGRAAPWIALLLAACATASAGTAATGILAFHHEVEVAQGEEPR